MNWALDKVLKWKTKNPQTSAYSAFIDCDEIAFEMDYCLSKIAAQKNDKIHKSIKIKSFIEKGAEKIQSIVMWELSFKGPNSDFIISFFMLGLGDRNARLNY